MATGGSQPAITWQAFGGRVLGDQCGDAPDRQMDSYRQRSAGTGNATSRKGIDERIGLRPR